MAKVKETVKAPTKKLMELKLQDYFLREDQIKAEEKLQSEIKAEARAYAEEKGTPDANGSIFIDLSTGKIQLIQRESVSLDQEKTIAYLRSRNLGELIKREVVYSIDEDKFEELVRSGSISAAQLSILVNRKPSQALFLRKPSEKEKTTAKESDNYLVSMMNKLEL